LKTYCIVIPGRAVPAARMTVRGKWIKRQAQRYLAYKELVGYHARRVVDEPLRGSVRVLVDIFVNGGKVGDLDNYYKSVTDSLNGVCWYDDSQIVDARMRLRQASSSERERVEVTIWGLEE
jgi:Holliday junction resolvase RusA-like endonuclease